MSFFIYYLLLYFVIFVIRILKVVIQDFKPVDTKMTGGVNPDGESGKFQLDKWLRTTFIGMDIVYGASGLVVVLFARLTGEQTGLGIVLFVYLSLLIIAVIADIVIDKFGARKAAYVNIFLVVAVVGATYWVSVNMLSKAEPSETHYRIAIPYKDSSLLPWGFNKYKSMTFAHYIDVTESNEKVALEKAKGVFWKTVMPLVDMKVSTVKKNSKPQKNVETQLSEDAYKKSKIEIDESKILITKLVQN